MREHLEVAWLRAGRTKRPRSLLLVGLCALGIACFSLLPSPGVAQTPEAPVTTSQIALIQTYEEALLAERGSRYRYLVIRDTLHEHIEELRAANPGAEIILYKNSGFSLREPGCPYEPFQGGGASWCDVDSNEDLFLHSGGQRIESSGYSDLLAMNIGSSVYRELWVDSVLERLRDAHNDGSNVRYDGVWMDDVNLFPGHGMDGRIDELSDGQYREAAQGFAELVGTELESEGFKSIINAGMNPWEAEQRDSVIDLAGEVSAVNREGFVRWGDDGTLFTDPQGRAPFWKDEVKLMEDIQSAGAAFHAVVYGKADRTRPQRYARATFLMGWDGEDGSALAFRTTGGTPGSSSYLPGWTTDVGLPLGERYRSAGVWRRDFTGGTVLVNSRPKKTRRITLDESFKRPGGGCTGSVRVPARRAMILADC